MQMVGSIPTMLPLTLSFSQLKNCRPLPSALNLCYTTAMRKIKIGPHRVSVTFYEAPTVNDRPVFGFYTDDPHSIGLSKDLQERPDQLAAVMLHEILEAVNVIHGVRLKHRQIEQLTTGLTEVLSENPQVRQLFAPNANTGGK